MFRRVYVGGVAPIGSSGLVMEVGSFCVLWRSGIEWLLARDPLFISSSSELVTPK